jgi:DNA replication protein DnaC
LKSILWLKIVDFSLKKAIFSTLLCGQVGVGMEFMTSTILSGILYDGFVKGVKISTEFLKGKLQGWLFDDELIEELANKLNMLDLDELGQHVIKKRIDNNPEIIKCMQNIKQEQSIGMVNQNHYGTGDNVAGNKVINNGK